mgnify:CR=1 FL=1
MGLIWRVGLWGWACEERLVGGIDMRQHSVLKARVIPAACCLVIALLFVAAPAMAATTEVTVTKYRDNNYSSVENETTLDLAELQALSSVASGGPLGMQGGIFIYPVPPTPWAYTPGSMSDFGEQNGTYVRNITDQVGGMNAGDEIWVVASDGYKTYFNHTNVYAPHASQGEMILSWENDTSTVPTYENGIRLFFYTPDDLNFTNEDMRDSMASWYWRLVADKYSPFGVFPSAMGLSSRTVSDLKIYPPHRYDFETGGDTTKWAYQGGVGASPGLNDPSGVVDTSKIADDDGIYEQTVSNYDGEHAAQRFVFDVVEGAANIEKLVVTWDGTSSHDDGSADQGATVYIWKNGAYEPLSGDITSDIGEYIDGNGNVTVLVKQNAATTDDGMGGLSHSRLETDYVKLVVTHHHRNSNLTL